MGLRDLLGLFELTVVAGFVLCRGKVVERAVQPVLIPPLDPCQGGEFDLFGGAPGAAGADQLGLVQPIDCFRDGVAVADSSSPLPAAATVPAEAGYAATGSSAGWRGSLIS